MAKQDNDATATQNATAVPTLQDGGSVNDDGSGTGTGTGTGNGNGGSGRPTHRVLRLPSLSVIRNLPDFAEGLEENEGETAAAEAEAGRGADSGVGAEGNDDTAEESLSLPSAGDEDTALPQPRSLDGTHDELLAVLREPFPPAGTAAAAVAETGSERPRAFGLGGLSGFGFGDRVRGWLGGRE